MKFFDLLRARRRETYARLWAIIDELAEGDPGKKAAEDLASEVADLLVATDIPGPEFERRVLLARELGHLEAINAEHEVADSSEAAVLRASLLCTRRDELDGEPPDRDRTWDLVRMRHELRIDRARGRVVELRRQHSEAQGADELEVLLEELQKAQSEHARIRAG